MRLIADTLAAAVGPSPSVSRITVSTGSTAESSIGLAPILSASASRSGWRSTTMTLLALLRVAERAAISPTGPPP